MAFAKTKNKKKQESQLLTSVIVTVSVTIILWANIIHLVDPTTLRAALDRAIARGGQPDDIVGVGGEAGAAEVLLVTKGLDDNGVVEGSLSAGVQGSHVEDVDALHLSENLETLQTGGLFQVGGDGAFFGAGGEEVFKAGEFCGAVRGGDVSGGLRRAIIGGGREGWSRWWRRGGVPSNGLTRLLDWPGLGSEWDSFFASSARGCV